MSIKKFAFVFPGQGSQSVGMLTELTREFPVAARTFAEASSALGYDLLQLIQMGPPEKLNQTAYTQPALLAASVAVWRVWTSQGGKQPSMLAGHSLGEYTALVCANALNFATAVQLVAERGRLMQAAVPEGQGAMAALVGLDDIKVQEICEIAAQGEVLAPANFNAIGQVVVSGQRAAVERAVAIAETAGAILAKMLPVSVPSHCELMRSAAAQLSTKLAVTACSTPEIAVINNVDVVVNSDPNAIKDALVKQLYSPVRWVETVQTMAKQGIECIVECGPGKVLTGLNRRIVNGITTISISDTKSIQDALVQFND